MFNINLGIPRSRYTHSRDQEDWLPGSQIEWSLRSSWVEVPGEGPIEGAIKTCWFPQAPDNHPLFSLQRWQDPNSIQWHIQAASSLFFQDFVALLYLCSHHTAGKENTCIPACVRPLGMCPLSFLVFKFPAASLHKASMVSSWICCFSLWKLQEHQLLQPFSDCIWLISVSLDLSSSSFTELKFQWKEKRPKQASLLLSCIRQCQDCASQHMRQNCGSALAWGEFSFQPGEGGMFASLCKALWSELSVQIFQPFYRFSCWCYFRGPDVSGGWLIEVHL